MPSPIQMPELAAESSESEANVGEMDFSPVFSQGTLDEIQSSFKQIGGVGETLGSQLLPVLELEFDEQSQNSNVRTALTKTAMEAKETMSQIQQVMNLTSRDMQRHTENTNKIARDTNISPWGVHKEPETIVGAASQHGAARTATFLSP